MKKTEIEEMIERIKEIVPNIKIRTQPKASLILLLEYEQKYKMNTKDALEKYYDLGEEVHFDGQFRYLEKWSSEYNIFKIHKGEDEMINQYEKNGEKP